MTSRERILTALNPREPDRVPVDLGGRRSSGISAIAYPRLRAALGLEPRPIRVYDPVQQLAIVDDDVLDWAGADAIELGRGFCAEDRWWADWTLPGGTPCRMPAWALPERAGAEWVFRSRPGRTIGRMPESSLHFDQAWWPFFDGEEDLDRIEELYREHITRLPSDRGASDQKLFDILDAGANRGNCQYVDYGERQPPMAAALPWRLHQFESGRAPCGSRDPRAHVRRSLLAQPIGSSQKLRIERS